MELPTPFTTPYMVGMKNKITNNRTMLPTLKNNEVAGYHDAGSSENRAFEGRRSTENNFTKTLTKCHISEPTIAGL